MDDFRKCPITRQLLSPVGFPLEQLSVSVSLGKSPKYTTFEEVLAPNSDLHIHMWQCSHSASWGSFRTSNFFKFYRHTRVQAMGGLSVPEQVRPLAPPLPGLFLLSCVSVRCGHFSVDELVVDERQVADHCWSSRCRPLAPARLHIPAGSCYSGDMKQLESDEFSNWWLKGADAAFIQLVRSSLLQILLDKKRWMFMEVTWTEWLLKSWWFLSLLPFFGTVPFVSACSSAPLVVFILPSSEPVLLSLQLKNTHHSMTLPPPCFAIGTVLVMTASSRKSSGRPKLLQFRDCEGHCAFRKCPDLSFATVLSLSSSGTSFDLMILIAVRVLYRQLGSNEGAEPSQGQSKEMDGTWVKHAGVTAKCLKTFRTHSDLTWYWFQWNVSPVWWHWRLMDDRQRLTMNYVLSTGLFSSERCCYQRLTGFNQLHMKQDFPQCTSVTVGSVIQYKLPCIPLRSCSSSLVTPYHV